MTAESGTSLKVTFVVRPEVDAETVFMASTGDHSCEVVAGSSPLTCLLNGLTRGEKYTVEAVECLGETKCSQRVRAEGYTQPDGEFNLCLSFVLIRCIFNAVFFQAPKSYSIEERTTTGFTVTMGSYTGNPQITVFKVEVPTACGTKTCSINRSSAKLSCPITDLSSGTQFVVKVSACFPGLIGCSSASEMITYTIPLRKKYFVLTSIYKNTNNFGCVIFHIKPRCRFLSTTVPRKAFW